MSYKTLINRMLPGRNGIDELTYVNLGLILILMVCDLFINNLYLSLGLVLSIVLLFYRIASRNIRARQNENKVFLRLIRKPKKKIKLYQEIIKNYNKCLYKRCPHCKQILKLPLKKGKHDVVCPECKNKFTVKCNRNEKVKVEIVK